jgi:hypothetical protein
MADRFIDFDAARAERKHEPLILKAFGREFNLPARMPAGLFLDILRLNAEKGAEAELSDTEAFGIMGRLLPKDVLDELLACPDFDLEDLEALTEMVFDAYRGKAALPLAPTTPPKTPARKKTPTA